jgi:hypothetical protein
MLKNKKILIIFTLSFVVFLVFITRINKEDLQFKSKYELINVDKIRNLSNNYKEFYVIIINTVCSGNEVTVPILKKNLIKLNQNNIPYFLIADEIFNKSTDNDIDVFKKKYDIQDNIYLLDIHVYPKNGGIFNSANRYNEFLSDLVKVNHNIPLGYIQYINFKNGKYQTFNNTIKN